MIRDLKKILKFFEKYPEVANEMIKKDKKAVMEIFNEE